MKILSSKFLSKRFYGYIISWLILHFDKYAIVYRKNCQKVLHHFFSKYLIKTVLPKKCLTIFFLFQRVPSNLFLQLTVKYKVDWSHEVHVTT